MAMTVIIALATAFVLSLTFVPAMLAVALRGNVHERENGFVRGLKAVYRPMLAHVIERPLPVIGTAVLLISLTRLLFTKPVPAFLPIPDQEKNSIEGPRNSSAP